MATYLSVALLGIAVVMMFTLHIALIWWGLMRCRHWFINEYITGEVEMQTQETTTGLSPGNMEKLPSYNYNNGGGNVIASETATCAICLESFCFGDRCRLLPQCKHSFHADCVDSWLLKCALCPICRHGVEIVTNETLAKGQEVVIEIPESS